MCHVMDYPLPLSSFDVDCVTGVQRSSAGRVWTAGSGGLGLPQQQGSGAQRHCDQKLHVSQQVNHICFLFTKLHATFVGNFYVTLTLQTFIWLHDQLGFVFVCLSF